MDVEAELKTVRLVFLCNKWVRFNGLGLKLKVNADAAADMLSRRGDTMPTNGPSLTAKNCIIRETENKVFFFFFFLLFFPAQALCVVSATIE